MVRVFVYGTLLSGECNRHVVEPFVVSSETGSVRGRLYLADGYPAMVLDSGASAVEGEWLTVTEKGLAVMDELEQYFGPGQDNDYERVWTLDADGVRAGWVYVWNDSRGCREIPYHSWKLWKNHHT